MAELTFETLEFELENTYLKVSLLKNFFFKIPLNSLDKLGKFDVQKNKITFHDISEKKAQNKFLSLISKHMQELTNSLNNHKAIYIHQGSGIPLIGYIGFGIVDRGTNLIEIRTITGCNLNCIFCSVDEGTSTRKTVDFVVEKDYLVEEVKKVVQYKECPMEIHLNPQGEPLLYIDMIPLIKDLSQIKDVKIISMDTNGALLTKELVDQLTNAGMTRINISINSLHEKKSRMLAGTKKYDHKTMIEALKHVPTKCELTIAPVWLKGINDEDIIELIEFKKELEKNKQNKFKIRMGIQNFLEYKKGRSPTKQRSWKEFYDELKELEKKYNEQLILTAKDFGIEKHKPLEKTMKKGDIVSAEIKCEGRYNNEVLAVANQRLICVHGCDRTSGKVKIKLTRDKDNIYEGICL